MSANVDTTTSTENTIVNIFEQISKLFNLEDTAQPESQASTMSAPDVEKGQEAAPPAPSSAATTGIQYLKHAAAILALITVSMGATFGALYLWFSLDHHILKDFKFNLPRSALAGLVIAALVRTAFGCLHRLEECFKIKHQFWRDLLIELVNGYIIGCVVVYMINVALVTHLSNSSDTLNTSNTLTSGTTSTTSNAYHIPTAWNAGSARWNSP